jgi:hypothetical protein
MSETPTDRSGSPWFRGLRPLVFALVVLVVVLAVLTVISAGSPRAVRPDRGPGPVRGVRLTEFRPGEGDQTCSAVGADLPVVRLVEQVDLERMVVCLGPGRRVGTLPLEPYALEATDPDGERLLDAWAAAWSLPDERQNNGACPAIGVLVPPSAITVAGVTMRPVPPFGPCQPLPLALSTQADIAQAARLAS